MLRRALTLFTAIVIGATSAAAQRSASNRAAPQASPTPEELTLHPGDTLTWTTTAPHQLRFGGSVTHGGPLALTPWTDVQKVLDVQQSPTVDGQGVARWPSGTPVTATVKADAATSTVKEFFFTCGFNPH